MLNSVGRLILLSALSGTAIVPISGIMLAVQAQEAERAFNIEAQPLSGALLEFSRQSDLSVAVPPDLVENKRAPAVKGTLKPATALDRLLVGSGLKPALQPNGVVTLAQTDRKTSAAGALTANPTQTAAAQADNAPAGRDVRVSGGIEEVIVTATKRAERAQDIPISLSVITADDIAKRGLVNAEDYLRGMPGVNQVDGFQGQAIVMRGIETTPANQTFSQGTTVATYFGETPTSNSAGLAGGSNVDIKLVDVERVELLRGPQGTAFGSSSMGGTVRTIPIAPKLGELEGKAVAGYSVTSGTGGDNYTFQAVGNLPVVEDRLAVRGVLYRFHDSGFYRNVAGSNAAFQTLAASFGAQATATNEDEVGSYGVVGGRISALLQATDEFRFSVGFLNQETERDGIAITNETTGPYDQTLFQVAPEHVDEGRRGGWAETHLRILNATAEYDLGWASLLATYSHTRSGWKHATPFGATGGNYPLSYRGPSPHREDVGEVRLTTNLDGAWNFLGGVYIEDMHDEVHYDYVWSGDPARKLAFLTTNSLTPRLIGLYNDVRDQLQKAAYGEASWEFLDGLTLTGGIRYYDYDRTIRLDNSGAFYGAAGQRSTNTIEQSGPIGRASLSYDIDDNALVYASWSQGFRLGRPQLGLLSCDANRDGVVDGTTIPVTATQQVKSDSIDSYEIGGKATTSDRRVSVSGDVFRMDWHDVPVRVIAGTIPTGCGLGYVANAGKARSEGVELQLSFQVAEPLRLDLGGSWTNARLVENVPAVPGAVKGNELPGTPKLNLNASVQYAFRIGERDASLRSDIIYVGPFYGDLTQNTRLESGDYIKLDIAGRMEFEPVSIDLYVNNATNRDTYTFRGTTTTVGAAYGYRLRPRTIGMRLNTAF